MQYQKTFTKFSATNRLSLNAVMAVLFISLSSYFVIKLIPELTNCFLCDAMETSLYTLDKQFDKFQEGSLTEISVLEELQHDQDRLLTRNNYGCRINDGCPREFMTAKQRLIELSVYLQNNHSPESSIYLWKEQLSEFNYTLFETKIADINNHHHNHVLGRIYYDGVYVTPNYFQALEYFSQSFDVNRTRLEGSAKAISRIFKSLNRNELAAPWESFYSKMYIGDVDSAEQVFELQRNANRLRGQWERGEYTEMGTYLRETISLITKSKEVGNESIHVTSRTRP